MLPHGPEHTKSCSRWCGSSGASEAESEDACCCAHSSTCLASSSSEEACGCRGKGELGEAASHGASSGQVLMPRREGLRTDVACWKVLWRKCCGN